MNDQRELCGASMESGLVPGTVLGPCILYARHPRTMMHRDASGAQWMEVEPPVDWKAVAEYERGRAGRAEAEAGRLRRAETDRVLLLQLVRDATELRMGGGYDVAGDRERWSDWDREATAALALLGYPLDQPLAKCPRCGQTAVPAAEELCAACDKELAAEVIAELREGAARAGATIARVREFAESMRGWCSPHGVAVVYADRLLEVLDQSSKDPL